MHRFTKVRRLLLGGLAASLVGVGLSTGSVAAQPAAAPAVKQPDVKVGKSGELLVPLGGVVRFIPRPTGWRDVLTGNQDVLFATPDPADANAILLAGRAPGVTKLTVTYADGKANVYDVVVQPDFDLLRRVIQRAVPTAAVEVLPGIGNAVILTGYVNKIEDVDIILKIAQSAAGGAGGPAAGGNVINAIQVGGVQHVQIEVVVAQVDRTELRQRGFDFAINGTTIQFTSTISGLINPIGGGGAGIAPNANMTVGITPAGIFAALQALRNEGLAKFLSEPKVVTQSGRPAFIRSGGQQAVLSQTAGGLGSISVALEQIGTSMEVLPIVYGNGKIYLEVSPSVRTRNDGLGIQTSAGFSPGFTEQSAQSSVMLESGQTFAIGGLLESSVQATSRRIPLIGDLPYIGAAFSTVQHEERERELLVLVTPRLVDAMDCNQVPKRVPGRETRSPDDYELYLEGLLEAPRGQRAVWNGRCYNAAWKCDTNGLFPCKGNVCSGPAGAAGCSTSVGATSHRAGMTTTSTAAPVAEAVPMILPVTPAEATTPAALPPITPEAPPASGGK